MHMNLLGEYNEKMFRLGKVSRRCWFLNSYFMPKFLGEDGRDSTRVERWTKKVSQITLNVVSFV